MSQDLREMYGADREKPLSTLNEGHRDRFLKRLNSEMPLPKKSNFHIPKIAAAILVLVSAGIFIITQKNKVAPNIPATTSVEVVDKPIKSNISLGDLSPDLKKVEQYYVANINLELSQLQVSQENKGLVDSYMSQLSELNDEYQRLNNELNQMGPNEQTVTALIKNLQLRLQLLQKLKEKLNEIKTNKNETVA